MQSEFNEINLTNDSPHINAAAAEYTSVAATGAVAERADNIAEVADSIAHTSGKLGKFVSKTIALAGVITVAATVAVAAADATVTPAAPSAIVSDIAITSFIDESELTVEFTFTDIDELEEYTVWIEDINGVTSDCGVENEEDIYTVYATLADGTDTDNLYLIIYATTNDGWSGEIARQQLTLPVAPGEITDIAVTSLVDNSELAVEFTFTDVDLISEYTVWIEDINGVTSDCGVENEEDIYTVYTTLADGTDTDNLYLIIYATTNDGWQGEICRQQLTLPVASDEITDIAVTSLVDNSQLTVEFIFTDIDLIKEYTVWIEDINGVTSDCGVENVEDIYTVYTTLADGTDTDNLYLVIYATTNDGWSGEICRQRLTLPAMPADVITEIGVTRYADNSELAVSYTITDTTVLKEYTAWIENGSGVVSNCTIDDTEGYIASTTLADGTDTDNLYLVIYATTNDGWSGEIVRELLTLPAAPYFEAQYVGVESYYSLTEGAGDVDIYIDYGTDYPETIDENIYGFEVYLQDEDGQTYECTLGYSGSGYMQLQVTLPVDGTVSFDIYGRLTIVVRAYAYGGWEGTVCSEKHVIATEGYIKVPEIIYVDITSSLDGEIYYTYVTVETYDPDVVWSDLYITVYDDNGELLTEQLMTTNGNIGWEDAYYNDEICGYIFYISYQSAAITLIDDYYLYAVITATWSEPQDDGTEITYESVVYDNFVYLT